MEIRYKNLSLGYLGEFNKNATINSQYYAHFFNEIITSASFSNFRFFPQRIPRSGFFEELHSLETQTFQNKYKEIIFQLEIKYKDASKELSNYPSKETARLFINWSNVLLRYGQFEIIDRYYPEKYSGIYALEIDLIKEINSTEIYLSNDQPLSIDNSINLAKKYLHQTNVTSREIILLLNHIIVTHYRYHNYPENYVFDLTKLLLGYIDQLKLDTFASILHASTAYRGAAMAKEFGSNSQSFLLDRAEELARQLVGETEIEKLVAKDNLYTCLQTMSKWNSYLNQVEKAECYLTELLIIDPYDSTGYSELGLFYFNNNKISEAVICFQKAMELGPPGAGMNAYYYANCLEELGRESEYIHYLHEATKLDYQAISPWLDLIQYYIKNKLDDKASQIAYHIYNTPVLIEQLEEDEINTIQIFIK